MTDRDRGVDALRALAIAAIVLGHWLVTALVLRPDGALEAASPLTTMDAFTPVTWLLQTLGVFFFAAGWGAARSRQRRRTGRGSSLWRLIRPVVGFATLWTVALLAAAVMDAPTTSLRTLALLAAGPLWFVAVLAALSLLAGPLYAVARHPWGPALATVWGIAVVATAEAGYGWVPVTVFAAWLVPYVLGLAAGAGRLSGRYTGWALAAGGLVALLVLILAAGYPASAVRVPGAGRSNLNPPTLATVALALTQVGVALLARPALARWLARPGPRRVVTAVNASAMRIYLWHQSVLVAVTLLALRLAHGAPVPGLHTRPDALWLAARLVWLPVFAVTLAAVLRLGTPRAWAGRTHRAGTNGHLLPGRDPGVRCQTFVSPDDPRR